MRLVVKVSGHLVSRAGSLVDADYVEGVAEALRELRGLGHRVYAVVGGGQASREYIAAARRLGAGEWLCDEIGIWVSRLHAMLLISALSDDAAKQVPRSLDELLRLASLTDRVVVCGGFHPGQSTTAVAALVAEGVGADLLLVTMDVDGIYTGDPKVDPSAKKLDSVHISQLEEMFGSAPGAAGLYKVVDPVALMVMRRSKVPTRFICGEPPSNIVRAALGERLGTEVRY